MNAKKRNGARRLQLQLSTTAIPATATKAAKTVGMAVASRRAARVATAVIVVAVVAVVKEATRIPAPILTWDTAPVTRLDTVVMAVTRTRPTTSIRLVPHTRLTAPRRQREMVAPLRPAEHLLRPLRRRCRHISREPCPVLLSLLPRLGLPSQLPVPHPLLPQMLPAVRAHRALALRSQLDTEHTLRTATRQLERPASMPRTRPIPDMPNLSMAHTRRLGTTLRCMAQVPALRLRHRPSQHPPRRRRRTTADSSTRSRALGTACRHLRRQHLPLRQRMPRQPPPVLQAPLVPPAPPVHTGTPRSRVPLRLLKQLQATGLAPLLLAPAFRVASPRSTPHTALGTPQRSSDKGSLMCGRTVAILT